MLCLPSSFCCCCWCSSNQPFWLVHQTKKQRKNKEKLWNFLCDDIVLPLWPNYVGDRGRTLDKPLLSLEDTQQHSLVHSLPICMHLPKPLARLGIFTCTRNRNLHWAELSLQGCTEIIQDLTSPPPCVCRGHIIVMNISLNKGEPGAHTHCKSKIPLTCKE